MADDILVKDLVFRPCEHGFIFYDDGRREVQPRTWAFGTVEDAAAWLVKQFVVADLSEQGSAESHLRLRPTR